MLLLFYTIIPFLDDDITTSTETEGSFVIVKYNSVKSLLCVHVSMFVLIELIE